LDIIQTIQQIIAKDLPTYRLENDPCYYVDMPWNLTMIEEQSKDIDVVNLDEGNLEVL
jgi:hypothetical protein